MKRSLTPFGFGTLIHDVLLHQPQVLRWIQEEYPVTGGTSVVVFWDRTCQGDGMWVTSMEYIEQEQSADVPLNRIQTSITEKQASICGFYIIHCSSGLHPYRYVRTAPLRCILRQAPHWFTGYEPNTVSRSLEWLTISTVAWWVVFVLQCLLCVTRWFSIITTWEMDCTNRVTVQCASPDLCSSCQSLFLMVSDTISPTYCDQHVFYTCWTLSCVYSAPSFNLASDVGEVHSKIRHLNFGQLQISHWIHRRKCNYWEDNGWSCSASNPCTCSSVVYPLKRAYICVSRMSPICTICVRDFVKSAPRTMSFT